MKMFKEFTVCVRPLYRSSFKCHRFNKYTFVVIEALVTVITCSALSNKPWPLQWTIPALNNIRKRLGQSQSHVQTSILSVECGFTHIDLPCVREKIGWCTLCWQESKHLPVVSTVWFYANKFSQITVIPVISQQPKQLNAKGLLTFARIICLLANFTYPFAKILDKQSSAS